MYYGQTGRKIRNFFKELRKAARRRWRDRLHRGDRRDRRRPQRHAVLRRCSSSLRDDLGSGSGPEIERSSSEGISGVVNELLIQLQSFDQPTMGEKLQGKLIDSMNRLLPANAQIKKKPAKPSNILVIGATDRAADLDPALLRPGRFDRSIHFDVPSRSGRREIIDYYVDKKAHVPELDKEERRDTIAAMTFGYTPVMLEHLFDEALVWALRDNRDAMDFKDVQQAKMTTEIGLKQPVEYEEEEKRTIATHEAGHAVVAYLVGQNRKLEVLSIIKRRDAVGLLAHSDGEERFTKTRSELIGMMKISFGGMSAEELFFRGVGYRAEWRPRTRNGIAAQMVGSFGMAGSLVSLEAIDGPLSQGIVAKVLGTTKPAARWRSCSTRPRPTFTRCSTTTVTS